MPRERATPPSQPFPVVALGAGLGGGAALEAFFGPGDPPAPAGMAFVLVSARDGEPPDRLAARLGPRTPLPVCEGAHGMALQPGRIFIVPPHPHPAIQAGRLSLPPEPGPATGPWLPVDHLFRSLARDRGALAIGIVLAGAGADGAQGLAAIKAEGGMTMAQLPATAEPDGMPRHAAATRRVDFVLAPAAMPAQLLAYAAQAFAPGPAAGPALGPRHGKHVDHILTVLRHQTGQDCGSLRRSLVQQRISRRMAVTQMPTLGKYLKHLQRTPAEAEALLLDLQVGVSQFFRDPEAFRSLEQRVIPALFAEREADACIRVWVPGCSTGEEAYAVAILLAEGQLRAKGAHPVQVFASDLDARAIQTARAGVYPATIAADLTPDRLRRWFTPDPASGGYRIQRSIRELVTFSEQDLLKDPPFSRVDFISCRNLLDHMSEELQKKLVTLLHYALNPGGRLLLGLTESLRDAGELFDVADAKARLYQRRPSAHGTGRRRVPPLPELEPRPPHGAARTALADEDLYALREDLHSAHEELQSNLEEAQTSRTELLSANLELGIVNAELGDRVQRLTQALAEMDAFLAGPGLPMIFLDTALRILRFTPSATSLVNLIPADVGRPLAHLTTHLAEGDQLAVLAGEVLATRVAQAREVTTLDGVRGRLRVQPFLDPAGVLVGVVILLVTGG